jgi:hypothetical protein
MKRLKSRVRWRPEGAALALHGFALGFTLLALQSARSFSLQQELAGDFTVVEWVLFTLNILVVLVAFACDDNDVARTSILDGDLDGLATIRNHSVAIRTSKTSLRIV